jgi:hypothetical protein
MILNLNKDYLKSTYAIKKKYNNLINNKVITDNFLIYSNNLNEVCKFIKLSDN